MTNRIEYTSLLSVPLTIKAFNNATIGAATGFFWRTKSGRAYLVSNYHVFSGNHYIKNDSIRKDSSFPARLEYPRFLDENSLDGRVNHVIKLCDEAGLDPEWRCHPIHAGHPIDVAVVEVPEFETDGSHVIAVNDNPLFECEQPLLRYAPGFELSIVGFFLKDRPTGFFPIYIKGSVASEMNAAFHGKRAFLVDALTSSGMSGSPVFATGLEQEDASEKWSNFKANPRFVGIYSGRITEKESDVQRELQVGLVWSRELIHEIIQCI